jgi:hypothetical protein
MIPSSLVTLDAPPFRSIPFVDERYCMKVIVTLVTSALVGSCLCLSGGCSKSLPEGKSAGPPSNAKPAGADDHDHGKHPHPSTGPHGGALIELGKEEYHAELIHDDAAGTVTIYILDHDATDFVAIDAKELRINLKHHGKGEQFVLDAAPQDADEKGKASRFVSKDKELGEDLDHEDAEARLVVEIGGKSYTGEIKGDHDHDHDGHNHKE